MMRNWKIAALVVLTCSLMIGVPGCFLALLPTVEATLSFSQLVGTVGGPGEVTAAVTAMPGGGLGALAVGTDGGGFRYNPAQFQVTDVVGMNGFTILAKFIDNVAGEVRFVAVNPVGGMIAGDVITIVGTRVGGGGFNFQVAKANLDLADTNNNSITAYALRIGRAPQYYVKGGS